MTLETDLLQRDGSLDQQQQLELEIHGSGQTSAYEIPHYQSQGAKLLSLQKQMKAPSVQNARPQVRDNVTA